MNPISVFISYSRRDIAFAEKLYHDLSDVGFDVWWDKETLMNRGISFLQEIRDAITEIDVLILVTSPDSMDSKYVGYEWQHALELCKVINPLLIEADYDILPPELQLAHTIDFRSDYDTNLEALIEELQGVCQPSLLHGDVPQLPLYYLSRDEVFQQVRDYVLRDVKTTTAITGKARATGIQGMGGIGKSVLATAIARDCEIRRSFADGVYWLTLGQKPDLLSLHSTLSAALGGRDSFQTVTEWKSHTQRLMKGKQCLLILDDVWEKDHADAFSVLSEQSRMLVTSRDVGLVQSLEAENFSLDILDEDAALALLAQAANRDKASLPETAYQVARECAYLPLALTMVGAMVADDIDWDDILEALQNADLEEIEANFDYLYPSVFAAIEVSIKALGADESRYLELAAFKEDARIPEATLLRYWRHTTGQGKLKVKKMLNNLEKKSLLHRDDNERLYLHDLQYDYIRKQGEEKHDAAHYHKLLLEAYNPDDSDWLDIEWDTYLYEEIAYHLANAEQLDTLAKLLLNFDFLQHKLDATEPNALISDCDIAMGGKTDAIHHVPTKNDDESPLSNALGRGLGGGVRLLQSALSMSSHVLIKDKTQLGSQLFARLMSHREKGGIESLLDAIQADDKTPRLFPHMQTFQPANGISLPILKGHSSIVTSIALSGEYAISASDDKTLKVWNWQSGELIRTLEGHSASVRDIAVSGEYAISVSSDQTLKVWNWQSGELIRTLEGHSASVRDIAVSGEYAISASDDKTLKVWNWQNGEQIRTLEGHSESVWTVVLSDEYVISTSDDKTLKVWNWQSGELIRTLEGHSEPALNVAISGEYVISASDDKTLKVWNWQSGELIRTLEGHSAFVRDVATSGEYAISASSDRTLKVWNWQSGELIRTLEGHSHWVNKVAISGEYAISASDDTTLMVWNWQHSDEVQMVEGHSASVMDVVVSHELAISTSSDGTLKVWNWQSGEQVRTLKGHSDPVWGVALSGEYAISASYDKTLKVWNWQSGKQVRTLEGHSNLVSSVVISGEYAISASYDKTLKVWNWQSGEQIRTLEGHSASIMSVAVSGEYAISASDDRTLKVWNWQSAEQVRTLEGHIFSVRRVALSGEIAVSVSYDQMLKVWNWQTGDLLRTLKGHTASIRGLYLSGEFAISASDDQSLKIWNYQTGQCVHTFYLEAPVHSVAISEDGSVIVAGDSAGNVHFLRLNQGLRNLLGW